MKPATDLSLAEEGVTNSGGRIVSPCAVEKFVRADLSHAALVQLLDLLRASPWNPVLLLKANTPDYLRARKDFDLMSAVIEVILTLASESEQTCIEQWLEVFDILLAASNPLRQHYERLYELLSKLLSACNTPADVSKRSQAVLCSLQLLKRMAAASQSVAYLYLASSSSMTTAVPPKTPWPFHNSFTIVTWVNADGVEPISVLMRLRSSENGFECFTKGSALYYRILPANYVPACIPASLSVAANDNALKIGELPKNKWQFVSISHQRHKDLSRLFVRIEKEEKSFVVDYPEFTKKALLTEQTFFESFAGAVNSVLLFSDPLPPSTIAKLAALSNGISNEHHIKALSGICAHSKYQAWTAIRVRENSVESLCDSSYGILVKEDWVFSNARKYVDSVANVVPLFRVVSLMEVAVARKALCVLLDTCRAYLCLLWKEDLEKESKVFVRGLGLQLLSMNSAVCTEELLSSLGDLMTISPALRQRLLKALMATINFWINIDRSLLPLFWETLKATLSCDLSACLPIINVHILLHFMQAIDRRVPCCSRHSVSEEFRKGALGSVYGSVKSLLRFTVISEASKIASNVVLIRGSLTLKPSPCLFLFLITVLKEAMDSSVACAKILCKLESVKLILRAARDYPVDVKLVCISYSSLVLKQLGGMSKREWKDFKAAILEMLEPSLEVLAKLRASAKPRANSLILPAGSELKELVSGNLKIGLRARSNSVLAVKSIMESKPSKQKVEVTANDIEEIKDEKAEDEESKQEVKHEQAKDEGVEMDESGEQKIEKQEVITGEIADEEVKDKEAASEDIMVFKKIANDEARYEGAKAEEVKSNGIEDQEQQITGINHENEVKAKDMDSESIRDGEIKDKEVGKDASKGEENNDITIKESKDEEIKTERAESIKSGEQESKEIVHEESKDEEPDIEKPKSEQLLSKELKGEALKDEEGGNAELKEESENEEMKNEELKSEEPIDESLKGKEERTEKAANEIVKNEEPKNGGTQIEETEYENIDNGEIKEDEATNEEAKAYEDKNKDVKIERAEDEKAEQAIGEELKNEGEEFENAGDKDIESKELKSDIAKDEETKMEEIKKEIRDEEIKIDETKIEDMKEEIAKDNEINKEGVRIDEAETEDVNAGGARGEEIKTNEAKFEDMKDEELKANEKVHDEVMSMTEVKIEEITELPAASPEENKPEESKEAPAKLPYIYKEMIESDTELIYLSILSWIYGRKPEQLLKQESNSRQINAADIKYPKVLSFLMSFMLKTKSKKIMKACLNDLCQMASYSSINKQHMFRCKRVFTWLRFLETQWYTELEQDASYLEELRLAFELHADILAEGMNCKEGDKRVKEIFTLWSTSIQPKEVQTVNNFTAENIQATFSETGAWICFKNVFMRVLKSRTSESETLKHLLLFIEITLKAIIRQNLRKGFGIKITLKPSHTAAKEYLNEFSVPDQRLIETATELLLNFLNSSADPTTNTLPEHAKLPDSAQSRKASTTWAIHLANIGLRSCAFDNVGRWLSKVGQVGKHVVRLVKGTGKGVDGKVLAAELDNLLLCLAVMLREHSLARKSKLKARIANARNEISSVLFCIISEASNTKMKDFIAKNLKIDPKTLLALINTNDENSEALLDKEYGKMSEHPSVLIALERVSEESLEKLKMEFNSEASLHKERMMSIECIEPALYEDANSQAASMKQYDILNKVRVNKWRRKWAKLEKNLKQWQGFWRNRELFEDPNKLPLKLSKHLFKNGCRCVMKLRSKKTQYIADKEYPKDSLNWFGDEVFKELTTVCPVESEEPILRFMAMDTSLHETDEEIIQAIRGKHGESSEALDSEIYTCFCAKKGKVFLFYSASKRDHCLAFVHSVQPRASADVRVMLAFALAPNTGLAKCWRTSQIAKVCRKTVVERRSGLEIADCLGKSVLLNFRSEAERDLFSEELAKVANSVPLGREEDLTRDWTGWKISTLDYLMELNRMALRSVDNVSQYPVLPWIFNDVFGDQLNLSDELAYRNLDINLGLMGEESKAQIRNRCEQYYNLEEGERCHFGSHYSHQGIIYQYLMRIFPFTEGYIKLFSGMDDPNRMFHSVEESLSDIKRDSSNIRELIPEFYTLPHIFLNHEAIRFGRREDKETVNDVVLPPWAKGNPHRFVGGLREMLESEYVSKHVDKWIDLVFGYRQTGREAVKACNTFPRVAYEAEQLIARASGLDKEALMIRAYHWGQTPLQLFNKKHPKRGFKKESNHFTILDRSMKTSSYSMGAPQWKPSMLAKNIAHRRVLKVIDLETRPPSFIVVTLNGAIFSYTVEFGEGKQSAGQAGKSCAPSVVNSSLKEYNNNYFHNGLSFIDSSLKGNFPLVLVKKQKPAYLAQGGYRDGTIQLTQLDALDHPITFRVHEETVSCLELDKGETFAVSGSVSGEVSVYQIAGTQWRCRRKAKTHAKAVTCIGISAEMRLFCTSGLDGVVNVCSYSGNVVRTFGGAGEAVDYVRVGLRLRLC